MNLLFKSAVAEGLDRTGVLGALRALHSSSGIVLTFHRVLPHSQLSRSYDRHMVMSAEIFDQLLRLLKKDFHVVALDELVDYPAERGGRQRLAITFDDGWIDTYSVAFPLLRRQALPATVFVCSGLTEQAARGAMLPEERFARIWRFCAQANQLATLEADLEKWGVTPPDIRTRAGWSHQSKKLPMNTRQVLLGNLEDAYDILPPAERSFMTWDEAREMVRNGITFGSHTVRHCTLEAENDDTALKELAESRRTIASQLNLPCRFVAYPNGAMNSRTPALAQEAGYTHAFTTRIGKVNKRSGAWQMPRFPMENLLVEAGEARLSPARTRFYLQALPRSLPLIMRALHLRASTN